MTEVELMAAIAPACEFGVGVGMTGRAPLHLVATDAATVAATYAATDAATDAATRAATDAATVAATYDATYDAMDAATSAATVAATSAGTSAATSAATYAATYAATDDATDAATVAATRAATYAATDAATRAATYDATRAATVAATDAATYAATSAATDAATRVATDAATRVATRVATVAAFLVRCCRYWYRMHDGGSDWSAYPAYLSFFDRVAGLQLAVYEHWRHYEQAALNGGPRIMHAKFCIVSDRHTEIHTDREHLLHNETGPAKAYGDGWRLCYWHGVRVPDDFHGWDMERALREENSEVRRCAIERLGWENLTDRLTLVAECPDPGNEPHRLRLFDGDLLAGLYGDRARLLVVCNGSVDKGGRRRVFGLPVPASVDDPLAAAALLFDVPVETYQMLGRRT